VSSLTAAELDLLDRLTAAGDEDALLAWALGFMTGGAQEDPDWDLLDLAARAAALTGLPEPTLRAAFAQHHLDP